MSATPQDTSGVRFPPPLIYAGLFIVGYAVHRFVSVPLWGDPPASVRVIGWCLVGVWVLLTASAVALFRNAGTTPNPTKARSEERRVGKECRSRWSPYH